jgi:hypothetical protein
LYLSDNPLDKLDLSPLFTCPVLELLSLTPDIELIAAASLKTANTVGPAVRDLFDKISWWEDSASKTPP